MGWAVAADFTQAPFADNSLFAITGPTGAGKSTLLDAICLALYHETPRLKSISASVNDIMTRHTVDCLGGEDGRPGALDQQHAQVHVPTLCYRAQVVLAAAGVLLGRESQPGAKLRPIFELFEITHRGYDR